MTLRQAQGPTGELGTPIQGVTLYSFTRAFHGREYDLEQLIRKVAAEGYGPGLEIIGFSSFRGFPEVDDAYAGRFSDLVDELGLVRDSAERLGMVLGQIWRSVRIVADIGMHTRWPLPETFLTSERTWTPELARTFLEDFAMVEPDLARFEVDRYLGIPGQALAFKVGAKLWMEARAAWRDRHGHDAPLAHFHRDALALGPMGLGPLRTQLLAV